MMHVSCMFAIVIKPFLCVLLSVLDVLVPNDCLALFANIFSIWLAMLFMLSWFAFCTVTHLRLALKFWSSHSAIFSPNRCVFFSFYHWTVLL